MNSKVLPFIDANQRYTIEEATAYLRQSRAKTYTDFKDGKLTPIRDGSRVYVSGRQLIERSRIAGSDAA